MSSTTGEAKRTSYTVLAFLLTALLPLSLLACTQPVSSQETLESLTAVTEAPEASSETAEALAEYDIALNPEPLAEPVPCTPFLVITARGTAEPRKKQQLVSPIARAIREAYPEQVKQIDLDYPADTDINIGGTRGVRLLIDTLNVQAEACPEQRSILLAYSQGALIVGDALAAPDGRLVGAATGELSEAAAAAILAGVFYGNPRFDADAPYARGTFSPSLSGILPRELGSLDAFAERLIDFCVKNDFVCQRSLELDESGHVAYFTNGMQKKGTDFVLQQIAAASGSEAHTPSS